MLFVDDLENLLVPTGSAFPALPVRLVGGAVHLAHVGRHRRHSQPQLLGQSFDGHVGPVDHGTGQPNGEVLRNLAAFFDEGLDDCRFLRGQPNFAFRALLRNLDDVREMLLPLQVANVVEPKPFQLSKGKDHGFFPIGKLEGRQAAAQSFPNVGKAITPLAPVAGMANRTFDAHESTPHVASESGKVDGMAGNFGGIGKPAHVGGSLAESLEMLAHGISFFDFQRRQSTLLKKESQHLI